MHYQIFQKYASPMRNQIVQTKPVYNTCVLSTQTKCENYLPEESETWCTFGDIEVKVDRIIDKQGYILRHLLLRVSSIYRST